MEERRGPQDLGESMRMLKITSDDMTMYGFRRRSTKEMTTPRVVETRNKRKLRPLQLKKESLLRGEVQHATTLVQ